MNKHEHVMEQVYKPRRLIEAWQQVRKNAGAAGIDQMEWFRNLGLVFLDDYRPASLKKS